MGACRTGRLGRSFAALIVALALVPVELPAQGPAQPRPKVDVARHDYGLTARALADGVYVVEGANDDFSVANGCNIINTGFIATGAGVLVINTGPSRRYGEQLRALIARTTREPVVQVLHLNLHPDYFLGNQAFADVPRVATPGTRAGMQREAKSYEDNLYRLCGDWMKGTEAMLPTQSIGPGPLRIGEREFELREFQGHTDSDLVLVDRKSGVAFVGGLVFADRVPTTPHADPKVWLRSLDALEALRLTQVVPSHGPVHTGPQGRQQTRDYIAWLDTQFTRWAEAGWEMNDVLRAPAPEAFRRFAGWPAEYTRNVAHLYPRYERAALQREKRP
ncbi:quinoprotein relay system zinc metallohydrolase 1 [Ideonella sp. A 288]|uniref:quinoprotein relay system zinc metallohydrolase 1 n=1 Tax=Ideonella sp. A 288 TaxID=1962181 RepID=UPI000B4A9E53|nr:quinoprotein relay system zinc metallohydrolase 1 [Ideonella sp. A 288]